jgi:hypothetical protein
MGMPATFSPRPDVQDIRWWDREDPHTAIWGLIDRIRTKTSTRRQMMFYHACLYGDQELIGVAPNDYDVASYDHSTLAFNVVRQNVDVLTAKIAKNRPLPMPLTSGGTFDQQRRAQKLGKIIQGTFEQAEVWETSPVVARDAALFGTGLSLTYRVGDEIRHDRVLPWEVVVDPRDAMYGKPKGLYLRRWIDRMELVSRFPDFEAEIEGAQNTTQDVADLSYDAGSDLVLVVEAWRLPSGDTPGKHVVCISNATLVEEDWKRAYFPLTALRMLDPVVGWFGTGIGEMLMGLQYTINDNAAIAQEAFALSGGYILVEHGSQVQTGHLDNGRGTIIKYSGTPPQWITPTLISPQHWSFTMDLVPKSFELTGVSQLSAQSQMPSGVYSGIALQTYNDIETERFALFARAYETYHKKIAEKVVDLCEEIKGYKVKAKGKRRGKNILFDVDYEKARLDREDFTLEVFPTSMLAKEPASRMQQVQELAKAGWITGEEAKRLLDFPDLERFQSLHYAAQNVVEEIIERFLDADEADEEGLYVYPEPPMNLELAKVTAQQRYLDAMLDGAEPWRLELIMRFLIDCTNEIEKANEPPPGASPPADGAVPPEMAPPGQEPVPPPDPAMMAAPPPGAPVQ